MNSHRNLLAWQACRDLIRIVYRETRSFPSHERFALTSQLRRAAVSTASNIAEGQGRRGRKEAARGASIALGSLAEVDTLFAVAEDEGYFSHEALARIGPFFQRASQLTYALWRSKRSRIPAESNGE